MPRRPRRVKLLTADAGLAAQHAELHAFPGHRRAHLDRVPQQYLGGGERLLRQHAVAPGLMMPAFSPAISSIVSPSNLV